MVEKKRVKKKFRKNPNYSPRTKTARNANKTICINFFAGAGAGKSTIATFLHSMLKMHGITSEYTGEEAKDMAWEGRLSLKVNDVGLFGLQHNRQFRLNGQVDCMISDSPLLLSTVYRTNDTLLHALVLQEFNKYDNINFYVTRTKPYVKRGRKESKKGAEAIDKKTIEMLKTNHIPYTEVNGDWEGANKVLSFLLGRLGIKQLYEIYLIKS